MTARGALAGALALMLAGCTTTGPIVFNCDGFEGPDGYAQESRPSPLVARIRGEALPPVDPAPPPAMPDHGFLEGGPKLQPTDDPKRILTLDQALDQALARAAFDKQHVESHGLVGAQGEEQQPTPAALLLSGGGQWGAFGAGYLRRLHERGFGRYYDFSIVTGVSTGAFQSLFVAVGTPTAYEKLASVYAPPREKHLVRRFDPRFLAAVTGEMAAIGRLRSRLEEALCEPRALAKALKSNNPLDRKAIAEICPLMTALAQAGASPAGRNAFIGMVRADDGKFISANATQIARDVIDRPATAAQVRNAQQCITAIGLASAAMPLFYQQVQIGDRANNVPPRTYFDGGVRQSVFEAQIAQKQADNGAQMPIFVLRNGPTHLLTRGPKGKDRDRPGSDPRANNKTNALDAAMRAEQIVVNQIEVQSIADLRLSHPTGAIRFITADGFHQFMPPGADAACGKKNKNAMFEPAFMDCLQSYGRARAERGDEGSGLLDAWENLPQIATAGK